MASCPTWIASSRSAIFVVREYLWPRELVVLDHWDCYLDAYWLPRVRWSQTFVHVRAPARKSELSARRPESRLQILIAAYDDVMSAVCRGYENKKQKAKARTPLPTGRNKKIDNTAECDEWERYFGIATPAAQVKSNCLVALKAVALRWGREVVLHYDWASKGPNFCNLP
ncbi:uncharacterized protein B0I36DRAFT_356691 [Microdochium trichocladiopsis]|uniref:Uncharacterized protein n=1 Tax=Microdochium trichocladiopsis TaxID=1682393 RepID=A0A9P8XPW3_9PEZI|nr:uncharacterized protein B0I36DRAFT_356691 [Microdochium trichocladiopsis]KAH7009469.1 hypothetical protein B0I36DRAFT_356691 [Microdochium trichocladiopsis]